MNNLIMNNLIMNDLEKAVPFVPPITSGKVIKVYDGDTITIVSKLPYPESLLYKFRVRLARINAPEINNHVINSNINSNINSDTNSDTNSLSLESRDFLSSMVMNKIVELKSVRTDKYGRILAEVYCDNVNMSDLLLEKGYVVAYREIV